MRPGGIFSWLPEKELSLDELKLTAQKIKNIRLLRIGDSMDSMI